MKVLTNEFSTRSVYPMFARDFEVAVKFTKEELEGFKEELLRPPTNWSTVIGSADYISELERTLHAKYKQEKYCPILPFGGIEECFIIDTKSNIIKDINER